MNDFMASKKNVIFSTWGRPANDSFGIVSYRNRKYYNREYHSCRETFACVFKKNTKIILFNTDAPRRIVRFIRSIETKLKVRKTRFSRTQNDHIILIHVSPFWLEEPMRRSLFTALLRAGKYYTKKNPKHPIKYSYYLSSTEKAFNKFVSGYTHYAGRCLGWCNAFCYSEKQALEKLKKR